MIDGFEDNNKNQQGEFEDDFINFMDEIPNAFIPIPEQQDYELPKLVTDYVKVAGEYSIKNEFPATISFFMILGQILKDFYTIPVMAQRIDPRVHFAWFQTARTGKTAIWKMLEPICNMVFKELNAKNHHDCDPTVCLAAKTLQSAVTTGTTDIKCPEHKQLKEGRSAFDIFEIVEATDAAMVGSFSGNTDFLPLLRQRFNMWLRHKNIEEDDFHSQERITCIKDNRCTPNCTTGPHDDMSDFTNDEPAAPPDFGGKDDIRIHRQIFIKGGLEGSGLAQWDEFESSGIFKKKANNDNVLVYLQKFMNGLESKSNIIRKSLAGGDKEIACDCQRSMYATTYVPTNFLEILFNSGALQRALVYVKEIEEDTLHLQRDTFIDGLGVEFDGYPDCERFAKALIRIYSEVEKRYEEVGSKSKVFTFDVNAKEVLRLSYNKMEYSLVNLSPNIRKLARSFQINLIQYEMIFSTLICAIESVNRKDGKFIVTAKNMHQARRVVEPCYDYLIEWLQNSIKKEDITSHVQNAARIKLFKETYDGFKKEEGWVNQRDYLFEVAAKMGKGTSTIYRYWKKDKVSEYFEDKQVGRTYYIKWRKQE